MSGTSSRACEDRTVKFPPGVLQGRRDRESSAQPEPSVPGTRAPSRTSGRTLVLVGSLIAVAVMLAVPIRSWMTQQARLADLSAEIEQARWSVSDLESQKQNWQDEEFVEQQARERLNMVRPGEMGLIVLDPDLKPDVARPEEAPADNWYGRLWESAQQPRPVGADLEYQSDDAAQD